jgi:hypothetical protein
MSILVLPSFLGMSTLRGGKRLINVCLPTQCLPADHLGCQIAQAVEELDLAGRDGAANELPMRSGGL